MDTQDFYTTMEASTATLNHPHFDGQPQFGVAGHIMQQPYAPEEYIQVTVDKLPTDKYSIVRNRMVILLVWVVAMAGLVGVFIGPKIGLGGATASIEADSADGSLLNSVVDVVTGGQADEPIVAQAAAPVATSGGGISPVFSREVQHWAPRIVEWASWYDLDPDMVATVMQIESCGDPGAESWVGAQGLFQVMPFHFSAGEDMIDPDTNANRGMAYLAERLVQTGGETGHAFAGYNGGHGAAGSNYDDWYAETQAYYRWSTGIYREAKDGKTTSDTLSQWMQAGGASLCASARARLGIQ